MSIGTLDPSGRLALRPVAPILRRWTAWNKGAMAFAIVQSLGLLALFLLGALPYLLAAWMRPRRL